MSSLVPGWLEDTTIVGAGPAMQALQAPGPSSVRRTLLHEQLDTEVVRGHYHQRWARYAYCPGIMSIACAEKIIA